MTREASASRTASSQIQPRKVFLPYIHSRTLLRIPQPHLQLLGRLFVLQRGYLLVIFEPIQAERDLDFLKERANPEYLRI